MKETIYGVVVMVVIIGALLIFYLRMEQQCEDRGGVRLRQAFTTFECYDRESLKPAEEIK